MTTNDLTAVGEQLQQQKDELQTRQHELNEELKATLAQLEQNRRDQEVYDNLIGEVRRLGRKLGVSVESRKTSVNFKQLAAAEAGMPSERELAVVGIASTSRNGTSSVPPVQAARPTGRTDARDGTLLPEPPSPTPPSEPIKAKSEEVDTSKPEPTGSSEEPPAWAKEILDTLGKLSDTALPKGHVEVLTKRPAAKLEKLLSTLDGIDPTRLAALLQCFDGVDLAHMEEVWDVLSKYDTDTLDTVLKRQRKREDRGAILDRFARYGPARATSSESPNNRATGSGAPSK